MTHTPPVETTESGNEKTDILVETGEVEGSESGIETAVLAVILAAMTRNDLPAEIETCLMIDVGVAEEEIVEIETVVLVTVLAETGKRAHLPHQRRRNPPQT